MAKARRRFTDAELDAMAAIREDSLVPGLRYLATFRCQHGEPDCDHADRGGVCNSCWARGWAERHIRAGAPSLKGD